MVKTATAKRRGPPGCAGADRATEVARTFAVCGVDLYLDQQALDTTTPAGKLMFQITGAFAEFERSMIRTRVSGEKHNPGRWSGSPPTARRSFGHATSMATPRPGMAENLCLPWIQQCSP
jgi:hypothetical protein